MALWLICCVLLFITSRGYDWLSQQSWFWAPELSLPWLVLGGIGLAIASNRRSLQGLLATDDQRSESPAASATQRAPLAHETAATPAVPPHAVSAAPASSPSRSGASTAGRTEQRTSISFTVGRPSRRSPAPTPDPPTIDTARE